MLFVVTTVDNKVGFYVARNLTKLDGNQMALQSFGADNVAKIETPPANYNLLKGEKKKAPAK